ncbi:MULTISPECIES: PD-(D/E)XK motif protein [unclassified Streptomyces]|uniref:PD-(D/E)XK motif protein n=1 Tax=unclassified Streptomyces TaxID=2593676 RepID=UPI0011622644|nr:MULTISPECIES: PD-(D/E)XK motif protein [unclassified Streptomyces]NMI54270.1 PD-(D/E)XK motif protein [Streptomyces sp. RLA2-12]QDN63135.1 PD-(D/E)XK motif protein [Streptomyces sp. S1D4-20]QDN73187.1 PD-(D/E)XK motif protein [Streptomyces sp. S1D4-14]QDO55785.1 PD-(D/E)XK motif protein [Streptomyces sp. RLB3-5]QDO56945.1 PD-(D/E)XK motif protein [Streptomyces sp. RLB1-8]
MSTTSKDWRRELRITWPILAARRTPGEHMTMAPIGLVVGADEVQIALDARGDRHLLLPVARDEEVREDLRSAHVRITRERLTVDGRVRHYADLVCHRDDFGDLFDDVVSEVLERVATDGTHPSWTCRQVLDAWREMFQGRGGRLAVSEQRGLFGELTVLRHLLVGEEFLRPTQVWTGPDRQPHDFRLPGWSLEVKTLGRSGSQVEIHGLDQLAPPPSGQLTLVLVRLVEDPSGTSLPELAERVVAAAGDSRGVIEQLAKAGYSAADAELYGSLRYGPPQLLGLAVDADFPALTHASLLGGLPAGIEAVRYTLDVSDRLPGALAHERLVARLEGRSVR